MYLSAGVVAKSAWLYVAATGVCLSIIPPQPKPAANLRKKFEHPPKTTKSNGRSANQPEVTGSFMSRWFDLRAASATFTLSYFPYLFSTWVMMMCALDAFHALDLFTRIMPVDHTTTARVFNPQLIAGLILTSAFTALRFASFQTLGRLFTFQLAILPEHKLVTHGVYSYVRHPSYTATPFIFAGVLLTVTAPGSVLYDLLGEASTRRLMVVLALAAARGSYVLVGRAEIEDQVLRKEFGKEWEEWARVVRYKFIPGLL